MSTTPAPRTLFLRWIDDAAVFPPGLAPVPHAWAEHVEVLAGGDGDLLGPLLIGAPAVRELAQAASLEPPSDHLSPVSVTVVGRPGTTVDELVDGVQTLQASPLLNVTGVEVAHGQGDWRRLVDLGLRTAVEVPTDGLQLVRALEDLAKGVAEEAGASDGPAVLAKLRTQRTPKAPAPDARQLAEFLIATDERALPFKLTGGLHRAVATGPAADEPHGVLNVLVATHHLLRGTALPELVATLEVQDGPGLAAIVASLSEQEVPGIRSRFVSFGCCGVLDPIRELTDLGLLVAPHTPAKESR